MGGDKVKVCARSLVITKRVIRNDLYELQESYLEDKNSLGMANDKVQEKRNVKFKVEQLFHFEVEPLVEDSTCDYSESKAIAIFAALGVENNE